MKQTTPSPLPIYLAAAVWPLYALVLPLYRPAHYLAAAVVSLAVGLVTWSLCRPMKPNPAAQSGGEGTSPAQKAEAPAAGDGALDRMLADGARAIAEMRRLNDSIRDEKVSAAIDQLERISGRIFDQVRANPEKLPQIRRFMDYYLPTTLKLLNAYDRMGSQGISGENIDGTMDRVERVMDTIVTAFARQLDALFGAEALDISTDITVLENLLAREGLADGPLEPEGPAAP